VREKRKIDQKEQKGLLLLGTKPCTTCKYGPYTVYIRLRPYIRRLHTVSQNQFTVIQIRIRREIIIYGYSYTAYLDTSYFRIYISGQPYIWRICTDLANPTHRTHIHTHRIQDSTLKHRTQESGHPPRCPCTHPWSVLHAPAQFYTHPPQCPCTRPWSVLYIACSPVWPSRCWTELLAG
jgi:hypothetical protein